MRLFLKHFYKLPLAHGKDLVTSVVAVVGNVGRFLTNSSQGRMTCVASQRPATDTNIGFYWADFKQTDIVSFSSIYTSKAAHALTDLRLERNAKLFLAPSALGS